MWSGGPAHDGVSSTHPSPCEPPAPRLGAVKAPAVPAERADREVLLTPAAVKLQAAEAAEEKERRRRLDQRLHPLAYTRAWTPRCVECGSPLVEDRHPIWHCPTPGCFEIFDGKRIEHHRPGHHTSQRHAFGDIGIDATAVLGGNGSGKTELGAQIAVATAAGSTEPWVRQWAAAVGFPLDRLPHRPGRVLASALTGDDSKRVLRSQSAGKIPKYLPAGSVWRNQEGDGVATVTLPNGGQIVFKSNDQGRRAYQGDWFDLVWLDEEHDFDVFEECEARVSRVPGGGGWILLTMTPLKGYTWVYDRFVKESRPNDRFHELDGLENPHVPLEKTKRWLNGLSPAKRAARRFGKFTALEGLVYDDFNTAVSVGAPEVRPNTNVCEPFEIPDTWRRYRAIDFGVRDPFVCLWIAIDPSDDIAYCYRELFDATGRGTRRNGETINQWSCNDPDVEWTVADSADLNSRVTLRDDCEIQTMPAIKDIDEGISAVQDRIRLDEDGKVHLVFFTNCRNAIREHSQWKWRKDTGGPNGAPQAPEDRDNHSCDSTRYWTYMYKRRGG